MKTYKFPKDNLSPVIGHFAVYPNTTVLSMTPDGDNYIVQLNTDVLPEGEYVHLNSEYGLEEVV